MWLNNYGQFSTASYGVKNVVRSNAVAVIECKHCSKKYHKDRWDEEKLQMHKCPLANKANDTVMYLKAENQQDRAEWIKELNKYCAPRPNKQLNLNPSLRGSLTQPPHFSSGSTSSSGASGNYNPQSIPPEQTIVSFLQASGRSSNGRLEATFFCSHVFEVSH